MVEYCTYILTYISCIMRASQNTEFILILEVQTLTTRMLDILNKLNKILQQKHFKFQLGKISYRKSLDVSRKCDIWHAVYCLYWPN